MTKFKALSASNPFELAGAYELDVPCDDKQGIVEFLEIMHEEISDEPLVWAGIDVYNIGCAAQDGEGRFYCVVPVEA